MTEVRKPGCHDTNG